MCAGGGVYRIPVRPIDAARVVRGDSGPIVGERTPCALFARRDRAVRQLSELVQRIGLSPVLLGIAHGIVGKGLVVFHDLQVLARSGHRNRTRVGVQDPDALAARDLVVVVHLRLLVGRELGEHRAERTRPVPVPGIGVAPVPAPPLLVATHAADVVIAVRDQRPEVVPAGNVVGGGLRIDRGRLEYHRSQREAADEHQPLRNEIQTFHILLYLHSKALRSGHAGNLAASGVRIAHQFTRSPNWARRGECAYVRSRLSPYCR